MKFEDLQTPDAVKPLKDQPKPRKKRQSKPDLNGLAKTLQGIHLSLAFLTKIEEFAIDDGESQALAVAINGVLEEFDLSMSPQAQALANLAIVSASIYAPRAILIRQKMLSKKAEKVEEEDLINEDNKTG